MRVVTKRCTTLAVATSAFLLGSACSAIVSAPPGPLRCDPTTPDVCPTDHSCICIEDDCTCVPCIARPEQCNGIDEDCDGVADNGLELDRDGDGAAGCAEGAPRDCDDTNPLVFPGNPEICNGFDDDCDLGSVETGSCPGGFCGTPVLGGAIRCLDPTRCEDVGCTMVGALCRDGTCQLDVPDDCNAMPSLCSATQICDATSGTCVDVGRDGDTCQLDGQCQSRRCYSRESLGLIDSGGICSRACCTDANCAAGFHCAIDGTGARGCVPSRPPDCGGTECVHQDDALVFQCSSSSGFLGGGIPCSDHWQCVSNLCREGSCADPCGSVADCPGAPFWSNGEVACLMAGYRTSTSDVRWVSVCTYDRDDLPNGTQGMRCGGDSACRDDLCVDVDETCPDGSPCAPGAMCSDGSACPVRDFCADACCNDDQCPLDHLCSPIAHNSRWEMHCVPAR
jgi:hypothetical protein